MSYPRRCNHETYHRKNLISYRYIGILTRSYHNKPITVTVLSKAWTLFARSNTGVMGSNPTRGMDVCVRFFCICAVLCAGSGLSTGSPTDCVKRLKNWKTGQSSTKGCRAIDSYRNTYQPRFKLHEVSLQRLTTVGSIRRNSWCTIFSSKIFYFPNVVNFKEEACIQRRPMFKSIWLRNGGDIFWVQEGWETRSTEAPNRDEELKGTEK
jgi:hypothetical protein